MVRNSVYYMQLILALTFAKYSNYFVKSSAAQFNFDAKKKTSQILTLSFRSQRMSYSLDDGILVEFYSGAATSL